MEWRNVLINAGFEARRGQQFSGGADSPDVICPALGAYHFEVKRVEALQIGKAMAQAVGDAGHKTPIVAHKKNREGWLVTMRAEDWLAIIKLRLEWEDERGNPTAFTETVISPVPGAILETGHHG